jgi:uncharacterized protein (DUF2141 family)
VIEAASVKKMGNLAHLGGRRGRRPRHHTKDLFAPETGEMPPIRSALLSAALVLAPQFACAQAKLDARYVVTFAGVTIGKGAWAIEITDDQYTAAASGATTGLLRVFASGAGTSAVRGGVANGRLVPGNYAATITQDDDTDTLRMLIAGGNVKEYSIVPQPPPPGPDRIPVTEAHLHGVTDPMSASLLRMPGNGDPVSPEACGRTVSIFDGRMRYNLQLAYKRMERVKLDKSYEGPVVVCAVFFRPIAGYRPERAALKYLIAQRDMEVALAPIGATRVLVPFWFKLPTPIGTGVMQATQFITSQQPSVTSTKLGQ